MKSLTSDTILGIVNQFKTPCFVYDYDAIAKNYRALRRIFPSALDIFYSIKANPAIGLVSEIYKMGAGLEVCSYFEAEAGIRIGAKPERILFVGPGKSEREIEQCLRLGVYAIVCESESELDFISRIAAQYNRLAPVILRINPLNVSKTASLKMGGYSLPFGLDEEIIFEKMSEFLKKPHVNIIGVHVYHGTRILDAETLAKNTQYVLNLAEKIQNNFDIQFRCVDIGGGLGIPYFQEEKSIDLKAFGQLMNREIKRYLKKFPNTKIVLEVGRFLVANAGVLISRIQDIKISRGRHILVTDGGMNCFMAASNMGSMLNRNFNISLMSVDHAKNSEIENYMITGPLCTPNDVMGRQVLLPKPRIGDFILIHNAGAYGPSASPVMFLSHGFPEEILYKNGKASTIRSRFSSDDFFYNQKIIQEENHEISSSA